MYKINYTNGPRRRGNQWFYYIMGFIFIRPIRYAFWQMVCATSPRWWFKRGYECWYLPNIHWYILYITVFRLCAYLYWDGWRHFAHYHPQHNYLQFISLPGAILKRIGTITAGGAISGGQCYHCASEYGNPVYLADDEENQTFILEKTWSIGTMDGTDHRFSGTTICPICGFRNYYEDGSL